MGSRIFAYTVYATEQKPPRVSEFLRILLGRGLPEFLDFCVYAAGQGPAWAPGFYVCCIRCKAETSPSSWIFAYTVYATEQKPPRAPDFRVYAAEQKPALVPGFLRIR